MHAVRNSQLLTFRCPPTPHQLSARFVFVFPSRAFGIDFFHFVMSRMTWKAEVSDCAVQSTTVLREPIQTTEKMKVKKFFSRFALRDCRYAPLYTAFAGGRTSPKYLAPALIPVCSLVPRHEENGLVNQVKFLGLEAHYGIYNHCINPAVLITYEQVTRLPCPVQARSWLLISGEKMYCV